MAIEHDLDTPLAHAVRIAGSQSAFGRLLGKRQSTIHSWLIGPGVVPPEHVIAVEAATGISRHVLRPDIYPTDPAPQSATPNSTRPLGDLEPAR